MEAAWSCTLDNIDACRVLDFKLRRTTKALKRWSMQNIGSVRLELFMVWELIAQLDAAQDHRDLSEPERELRSNLKRRSLGLASLSRTKARQRSRIRFLEEECNIQSRHTRSRPTLPRSGPTCVATRLSFHPRFAQNG
jgi:hypothetical protein